MKQSSKIKPRSRKFIYFTLLVVGISALALVYIQLRPTSTSKTLQNHATSETINFDPPAEEEQKAGDDQKQEIINGEETSTPPTTANVVIIDASQYDDQIEIRAFVSNIIQDGSCSIVATRGSLSVTRQVAAAKDATTTQCMPVTIPRSEFLSSGTWNLTVTYTSSDITGKANKTIEL